MGVYFSGCGCAQRSPGLGVSSKYLKNIYLCGDPVKLFHGVDQHAKHQMAENLGVAFDVNQARAAGIFQGTVEAFGAAALVIALVLGVRKAQCFQGLGFVFQGLLAGFVGAGIFIDDGDVPQRTAVRLDFRAVVGGIHQVVAAGDARGGDRRQRKGGLAVVEAGRGQQAADGDIVIDGIDVKFVTNPMRYMPLGVLFAAMITDDGQVGQHLF